ncbi:MAG: DNA polymerase IV [Spirochaetaceae bacterium]|nr:MAG: DNA polymerase IV [Spirochaetaceae bacterium]
MIDTADPVVFHCDLDAFYASVEQLDNPQYRDRPVIVGALPGHRGVVSACSYEARSYGVHSAMPVSQAHSRCPHGIFVPVRMSRYREVSQQVMEVFADFTPGVQQISVDEAFLDLSGTRRLFGPPGKTAAALKQAVRHRTGLTVTVGVAATRYVAKLASAHDKPDGLYVVDPGHEADFVLGLELSDLWGVGRKTLTRLQTLRIDTVAALRETRLEFLRGHFGESTGDYLYNVCRGIDPGIYSAESRSHSISSETTFEVDISDRQLIDRTLLELAEHVMFRLREERCRGATVTIKVRDSDFATRSAQRSLKHDLSSVDELYSEARLLLDRRWNGRDALRLIGLGVSGIEPDQDHDAQANLFSDRTEEKRRKVEQALVDLRRKRPDSPPVTRARLLPDPERPPEPEDRGPRNRAT